MPLGEFERDDLQDRGVLLLDADPLRLHRLRQRSERELHPVLHQHLVDVGIGADREGDRQDIGAVGCAGRLHVEHLVDAIDLILDRQRDRVDHGLGARAGIARRHLDGRRDDVGILRDRQAIERDRADDDQHDRQHVGEDGMLDEKLRDHRRLSRYWTASRDVAFGVTVMPGETRQSSPTTIRSLRAKPLVATCRLPTVSPSCT